MLLCPMILLLSVCVYTDFNSFLFVQLSRPSRLCSIISVSVRLFSRTWAKPPVQHFAQSTLHRAQSPCAKCVQHYWIPCQAEDSRRPRKIPPSSSYWRVHELDWEGTWRKRVQSRQPAAPAWGFPSWGRGVQPFSAMSFQKKVYFLKPTKPLDWDDNV